MSDDPIASAEVEYEAAHAAMLAKPYLEGADSSTAAIDRVVRAQSALNAARAQGERAAYTVVGGLRIPTAPEPEPELPKPDTTLTLPEDFTGFGSDVAHAQAAARTHGIDANTLYGLLFTMGQTPAHERTPTGASADDMVKAQQQTTADLVREFGEEGAEEREEAAGALVRALGLSRYVSERRLHNHPFIVREAARVWMTRRKDGSDAR